MTSGQDGDIATIVSLGRADVADAAVVVVNVVPMREACGPEAGVVEMFEALGGELRPVFGPAEQALREGVVVTHARRGSSAERGSLAAAISTRARW